MDVVCLTILFVDMDIGIAVVLSLDSSVLYWDQYFMLGKLLFFFYHRLTAHNQIHLLEALVTCFVIMLWGHTNNHNILNNMHTHILYILKKEK